MQYDDKVFVLRMCMRPGLMFLKTIFIYDSAYELCYMDVVHVVRFGMCLSVAYTCKCLAIWPIFNMHFLCRAGYAGKDDDMLISFT